MRTSCGSFLSVILSSFMVLTVYLFVKTLREYNDIDVQASQNPRALINDESPVSMEQDSLLWALEIQFGILYGRAWFTETMQNLYLERNGLPAKGI